MVKSPRLNLKGYDVRVALYRNKDAVKAIVTIITGYNSFITSTTGFNWKSFLMSIGIGIAALAGKLLADLVDFFFTEVEI